MMVLKSIDSLLKPETRKQGMVVVTRSSLRVVTVEQFGRVFNQVCV